MGTLVKLYSNTLETWPAYQEKSINIGTPSHKPIFGFIFA